MSRYFGRHRLGNPNWTTTVSGMHPVKVSDLEHVLCMSEDFEERLRKVRFEDDRQSH